MVKMELQSELQTLTFSSQVLTDCNGRIFYLFILSYRARLSYLIMALVLSLFFIYGCGLVSS